MRLRARIVSLGIPRIATIDLIAFSVLSSWFFVPGNYGLALLG